MISQRDPLDCLYTRDSPEAPDLVSDDLGVSYRSCFLLVVYFERYEVKSMSESAAPVNEGQSRSRTTYELHSMRVFTEYPDAESRVHSTSGVYIREHVHMESANDKYSST